MASPANAGLVKQTIPISARGPVASKPASQPGRPVARANAAAPVTVPVWDLAVRLFHWSLVVGVCLAWATGGSGSRVHEIAGCTVAGLVAFRFAWGFAGPRHARFSDFVKPPARILAYLRSMSGGRPSRTLGHNPAGGAMILALLALIVVLSVTGWLMLTPQFFGVPWVEDLHALTADALLLAVALHIAGVIGASLMQRENLVLAMLTGLKPVTAAGRPSRLTSCGQRCVSPGKGRSTARSA